MDHWRSNPSGSGSTNAFFVGSSSQRTQHGVDDDTTYYYYPPSGMGPYLSSSIEQRTAPKPKRSPCFNRTLPFVGVVILIVGIVVVSVTLHGGGGSDSSTGDSASSSNSTISDSTSTVSSSSSGDGSVGVVGSSSSSSCPAVAPNERTVVFWQSEVAGCDQLPDGVTHVVWGFALVADGEIVPAFQGADDTLITCAKMLRARCIQSIGGIGGATNNKNMSIVSDFDLFAQSAVALVEKYGFDGLDLDDETVGDEFNSTRVVETLRVTRLALDKVNPSFILTYDAYFFEGQPSFCEDPMHTSYSRCFPTGVLSYVDWINIMAYNAAQNETEAEAVYAAALSTTFVAWEEQLGGNFSLATIGVCVTSNCAFGPGPNATIISEWEQFARRSTSGSGSSESSMGGGMMIFAASGEIADDFPVTRSVLVS